MVAERVLPNYLLRALPIFLVKNLEAAEDGAMPFHGQSISAELTGTSQGVRIWRVAAQRLG